MAEPSDERLAAILASVGDHLVVEPADPLVATLSPPNGSSHPDDDTVPAPVASDPDEDTVVSTGRDRPQLVAGQPRQPRQPGGTEVADGSGSDDDGGREVNAGDRRLGPVRRRGRGHGREPSRARRGEGRRQALLVAAIVVVVAGTVTTVVVAPVREAVAGWLGIGSTEVVRVGAGEGDPGELPYLGDDLVPVDRRTAEARLGTDLPDTTATALGPAQVLAIPPEGGVILAWDDGATTLWVRSTELPPDDTVRKLLTFDDGLERIEGLGDDAAIVEGEHVLGTPQRRLAAGTVLVWIAGGFEHRLESDLDPQELIAIAHAITPG